MPEPSPPPKKVNPLMMIFASGMAVLHTRRYRRNFLFGLTLVTLLWVFVGAVFIGGVLMQRPVAFTIYWLVCFLLVLALSIMALYDLMRVRKEHSRERRKLEERLGEAMDEIKAKATEAGGDNGGLNERAVQGETVIDVDEIMKWRRDHDKAMGEEDRG